jgi:hypothetical protein
VNFSYGGHDWFVLRNFRGSLEKRIGRRGISQYEPLRSDHAIHFNVTKRHTRPNPIHLHIVTKRHTQLDPTVSILYCVFIVSVCIPICIRRRAGTIVGLG